MDQVLPETLIDRSIAAAIFDPQAHWNKIFPASPSTLFLSLLRLTRPPGPPGLAVAPSSRLSFRSSCCHRDANLVFLLSSIAELAGPCKDLIPRTLDFHRKKRDEAKNKLPSAGILLESATLAGSKSKNLVLFTGLTSQRQKQVLRKTWFLRPQLAKEARFTRLLPRLRGRRSTLAHERLCWACQKGEDWMRSTRI